jgi:hypothetical protein
MGNNELIAYKIVTEKQKRRRKTMKKRRNDFFETKSV